MNIVSLYFSLWVVNDMGGRDSDYALANSLSMFIVFLVAPFLGALSDQTPRRMPFLVVSTLICCAATLLLGITGIFLALVIFIVANTFYQSRPDLLRLAAAGGEHRDQPRARGRLWRGHRLHGFLHRRADGAHGLGQPAGAHYS